MNIKRPTSRVIALSSLSLLVLSMYLSLASLVADNIDYQPFSAFASLQVVPISSGNSNDMRSSLLQSLPTLSSMTSLPSFGPYLPSSTTTTTTTAQSSSLSLSTMISTAAIANTDSNEIVYEGSSSEVTLDASLPDVVLSPSPSVNNTISNNNTNTNTTSSSYLAPLASLSTQSQSNSNATVVSNATIETKASNNNTNSKTNSSVSDTSLQQNPSSSSSPALSMPTNSSSPLSDTTDSNAFSNVKDDVDTTKATQPAAATTQESQGSFKPQEIAGQTSSLSSPSSFATGNHLPNSSSAIPQEQQEQPTIQQQYQQSLQLQHLLQQLLPQYQYPPQLLQQDLSQQQQGYSSYSSLPPLALAYPQYITVYENTTVALDGRYSADYDGTIAAYQWTQTSQEPAIAVPLVQITGADTASPTFIAPAVSQDTLLTFSLVVTDNTGALSTSPSIVYVMVKGGSISSDSNVSSVPLQYQIQPQEQLFTGLQLYQ